MEFKPWMKVVLFKALPAALVVLFLLWSCGMVQAHPGHEHGDVLAGTDVISSGDCKEGCTIVHERD